MNRDKILMISLSLVFITTIGFFGYSKYIEKNNPYVDYTFSKRGEIQNNSEDIPIKYDINTAMEVNKLLEVKEDIKPQVDKDRINLAYLDKSQQEINKDFNNTDINVEIEEDLLMEVREKKMIDGEVTSKKNREIIKDYQAKKKDSIFKDSEGNRKIVVMETSVPVIEKRMEVSYNVTEDNNIPVTVKYKKLQEYTKTDEKRIGGLSGKYEGITRSEINKLKATKPKIDKYQLKVINDSIRYLGKPYLWGGTGPDKYDCSAFVREVYANNGVKLPRVSRDQSNVGELIDPSDITAGDLLFFDTFRPNNVANRKVTHVGMYIGKGMMIHASLDGIKIEDAFNDFFDDRFIAARRLN